MTRSWPDRGRRGQATCAGEGSSPGGHRRRLSGCGTQRAGV